MNDNVSWGKLLTLPPELSGNPTSRVMWVQVGGVDSVRILLIQYMRHLKAYFNML
jgi:hypothetical protein